VFLKVGIQAASAGPAFPVVRRMVKRFEPVAMERGRLILSTSAAFAHPGNYLGNRGDHE